MLCKRLRRSEEKKRRKRRIEREKKNKREEKERKKERRKKERRKKERRKSESEDREIDRERNRLTEHSPKGLEEEPVKGSTPERVNCFKNLFTRHHPSLDPWFSVIRQPHSTLATYFSPFFDIAVFFLYFPSILFEPLVLSLYRLLH